MALFVAGLSAGAIVFVRLALRRLRMATVARLIASDPEPSFVTGPDGRVTYRNTAAVAQFMNGRADHLASVLAERFADPAAVLARIMTRATGLASRRFALASTP